MSDGRRMTVPSPVSAADTAVQEVLALPGERLDAARVARLWPELRQRLDALAADQPVCVDLSAIPYADSSAVALMLALQRPARRRGQLLRWRSVPGGVLALAQLGGVGGLLELERAE